MSGLIVVGAPGSDGGGGVTDSVATPSSTFQVTLTGGDGSSWDLSNGPVRLLTGAQVFDSPAVTHWWNTSPVIDGSAWDGMRTAATDHVLPLGVLGTDWQNWRDTDAAFFRAIHPGSQVTFTVTAPDGSSRSKRMRFVSGGGVETIDPLSILWASYALEFTAANPFWAGDPVEVSFNAAAPVPLFPGPPFFINGASIQSASILNTGDEPASPVYVVSGFTSSWQVGVGDAVTSSRVPVADGRSVTVDTDSGHVQDGDGKSVYEVLDSDQFAAIPSGAEVPLNLSLGAAGVNASIRVGFTPLYRRPW